METLDKTIQTSLIELIDGNTFSEVCLSYYVLFDIPLRVFDQKGDLITEAVHSQPVCQTLGKVDSGRKKCTETRLDIKKMVLKGKDTDFIDCVCGLRYAITPIRFQEMNLGKTVIGPYLPTEFVQPPEAFSSLDPPVLESEIIEEFTRMRRVSGAAITKIVTAMNSVVDLVLFSAHKAHLTNQMHIASVRESYRELTEKNRQLEELHDQMQEFERLKSNFLATVSHELRTPLTSIIGYSDMLTEGIAGNLDDEQRQFVQTIKTKGDELLSLISSILDFSRIETGHLDLRYVEIDPKELVDSAVEPIKERAERRGTRLVLDAPTSLPTISLDPEKIHTAISHLVENAVKFSTPGGIVRVSLQIVTDDGGDSSDDGFGAVLMTSPDMLEIAVEDWGIGINEKEQGQIFSPFAQLDNSSTREQGGAGLGLAVVKHFVEAHGGQVKVKSRLGEGSKFTVLIPIIQR